MRTVHLIDTIFIRIIVAIYGIFTGQVGHLKYLQQFQRSKRFPIEGLPILHHHFESSSN